jgi:hypothetical protein
VLLPVTVNVHVPRDDELVRIVSVEDPVVGFVTHEAAAPGGSPETVRPTDWENPPVGFTVTV